MRILKVSIDGASMRIIRIGFSNLEIRNHILPPMKWRDMMCNLSHFSLNWFDFRTLFTPVIFDVRGLTHRRSRRNSDTAKIILVHCFWCDLILSEDQIYQDCPATLE